MFNVNPVSISLKLVDYFMRQCRSNMIYIKYAYTIKKTKTSDLGNAMAAPELEKLAETEVFARI